MMLEQVAEVLEKECRLEKDLPVLVGVSGGADSLCLLDVLHRLGYPLVVAHFNHRLRLEAEQDARSVQHLAASLGVQFLQGEHDVAAYARQNSFSVEEAARILRYRFLFKEARRMGAQAVAVGHTADDQVETVLMHLLRGSGLAGLKGMEVRSLLPDWDKDIPVVRPLLYIWREETLAYCQERGLHPVFDRSNLDTTYLRNRLRHELIPQLESYNPRARLAVWRMARSLAGDLAIVEAATQDAWDKVFRGQSPGCLRLDLAGLAGVAPGVQRNLLRKAIQRLRPKLTDLDFESVERCLELVTRRAAARRLQLADGLKLSIEDGQLYVMSGESDLRDPAWVQIPAGAELELFPGKTLQLEDGWQMTCRLVKVSGEMIPREVPRQDYYQAWLDSDACHLPLVVRSRRPGDRFAPFGMGGHSMKLSDFFINEKLPRRARGAWPLVCSHEDIAWIPGYQLAHGFRLKADTRQALHLRVWCSDSG
jgi:tRNA(Ile)-lysidine synthase